MTDTPPEYEPEHEEPRPHELDLIDLIAAKAAGKRAVFERLHGFTTDKQEDTPND